MGRDLLGKQSPMFVGETMQGDPQLAEVRGAGHLPGLHPGAGHSGQQQRSEDSNDRQSHQQLNQREPKNPGRLTLRLHSL